MVIYLNKKKLSFKLPMIVSVSQAKYILLKLNASGNCDWSNIESILDFPGTCSSGPSKATYSISRLVTYNELNVLLQFEE